MIRLKVKEIAESKHITMAKLSRMTDLNPGTIRAIYENPNRDVAVTPFEKIARALKDNVSDLYEFIPDESLCWPCLLTNHTHNIHSYLFLLVLIDLSS